MADDTQDDEVKDDAVDDAEETADDAAEETDDAAEDGEADDAAEEDGEPGGKAAGEAPQSRRDKRIATTLKERDEFKERAIRAEALAEERAKPQVNLSADEQKRIREDKLALMDAAEKKEFLRDEEMQSMKQTVLLTQLQTQDSLDKAAYDSKAATNPVYAKHAQAVAQRLFQERQRGMNYSRETILAQIVGESALKAKPKANEKKAATERVKSSESKSTSGRSDATVYKSGRGNESFNDLERRLENVVF